MISKTVKEFVEAFVEPNTAIRLHYKVKGGHEEVQGDRTIMDWELVKSDYKDRMVVGVTDIVYRNGHFPEAVNLTIER